MPGLGFAICIVVSCASLLTAEEPPAIAKKVLPQKVDADQLPNAWRIADNVISGGLPEGDEAFQQLAGLGVKTIISVDGMTPDVAAAKKHGLRYVHLPHRYDRIPIERGKELAKAVRDLPGPIYIHCHHGKHRAPAAATVACVQAGLLPASDAETVLKTAGTSPNYRGLYQSVREARPLSAQALDLVKVEFRETSPIPPLAEAMVDLEHAFALVKRHADDQWKQPEASRADALLLLEHYKEMQRLDDVRGRSARFRSLLTDSERGATQLQTALEGRPFDASGAAAALKLISTGCTDCHREFRDNAP